jgi:uracil-DNA glycosylase family 4
VPSGEHCVGCPNREHGQKFIQTDGLGTSGVMIVGDSPWISEIAAGRPFAGASGALLDRIFRRIGAQRNQFLITNAMWCKPPHLGWSDHPERFPDAALALNHCRPYLDQLIERFRPRAIVTLGGVALNRVLGVSGLQDRHAYIHNSAYGIPVVPSYHPSFIVQGNHKFNAVLMFALKRALEVAQRGEVLRTPTYYYLDDYEAMKRYLAQGVNAEGRYPLLSVDIETPGSSHLDEEAYDEESLSYQIIRCGFSHTPATACSFPWTEPFITLAKQALRKAEVTLMWNASYDTPRLEAAGCEIGVVHDAMYCWHFLQSDLPKGLGFVAPFYFDGEPWKHLNDAQPAFYNAVDNDTALRAYLGIRASLQREGRWGRWLRHCVQTLPVLSGMGRAGIRVDKTAQGELAAHLQSEYDQSYLKLQQECPHEVRPVKTYKRLPKDMAGITPRTEPCPRCSLTTNVAQQETLAL